MNIVYIVYKSYTYNIIQYRLSSFFSPAPCRFGGIFPQRLNRTAWRTGTYVESPFLLVEVVCTYPYWSSSLTVCSERGFLVSVHAQLTGPCLIAKPAGLSQCGGRLSRAFRTGASAMQRANRKESHSQDSFSLNQFCHGGLRDFISSWPLDFGFASDCSSSGMFPNLLICFPLFPLFNHEPWEPKVREWRLLIWL